MKLIVGLGNPGKEYEKTRHNAGFMVVEKLAEELHVNFDKSKCKALYATYGTGNEKLIIAKPMTYMNLSGEAVSSLMNFYHIELQNLIVIHDDLDLPLGKIRIRKAGSSGGQNGMKNIIAHLHSDQIQRIRVGISHDCSIDTADYVLGKFNKEDFELFDQATTKAKDALVYSLQADFEHVMSKYNG